MNPASLRHAIALGIGNVRASCIGGTHWDLMPYLGPHYVAQYFLMLRWLGRDESAFEPQRLSDVLWETYLDSGSWPMVRDAKVSEGDINATLFNYWALKALGVSVEDDRLARARAFVLDRGGIEACSVFAKIFLALVGQYDWRDVPDIPAILFKEWSPVKPASFGQWIGPHLLPMAYFSRREIARLPAGLPPLLELYAGKPRAALASVQSGTVISAPPSSTDEELITKMVEAQQPEGSWGGYTLSTLLCLMAFDDYLGHRPERRGEFAGRIERGFGFLERLYVHSGGSAYRGVTCNGRCWDSALMGIALAEAGVGTDELAPVADFLVAYQTADGGLPFGEGFRDVPDTDDTAEMVSFLTHFPAQRGSAERAIEFLQRMQNDDGGWGAFARNNDGNPLPNLAVKPMEDSADFFDESAPCVTGHILESFGLLSYTAENSPTVRKAVAYLQAVQDHELGAWSGRWGINYLYGTSAAVVGLIRCGENPAAPYLRKAFDWLKERQHVDGSYGESTLSYLDRGYAGVGVATPSQTAWALLALLEGGAKTAANAKAAARYLVKDIVTNGKWVDPSTVGTGHPGIVYMNYPSYPYAFPLIALARYARRLGLVPSAAASGPLSLA